MASSGKVMDPAVVKKLFENLQSDLRSLSAEGKRKHPNVKEASEQIQMKLRTISAKGSTSISGLVSASAEIVQPFVMGCETKNPKLVQICLAAVQKMISYEAISMTAADSVLGMLWQLMEAGMEDLKLLQTAILLITTNFVVQHESLAKALVLCFRLHFTKDSTTINTAAATIKQLVSVVFERVIAEDSVESQVSLDEISLEELKVGSKTPPKSLQPCAGDAYLLFQDLCQLVNADQPFWLVGMTEMTRTFGLELVEAVLTTFPSIFMKHKEFSFLLKERVCPLVIKLFSPSLKYRQGLPAPPSPTPVEKPFFPIVMRLLRIVSCLIRNYYALLMTECEIFLSLLVKFMEPEKPMWQRCLALEVLHKLSVQPELIKSFCLSYDMKPHSTKIFRDLVNAVGAFIQSQFMNPPGGPAAQVPKGQDVQGSPPSLVAGMPVGSGVTPQPAFMYRGVWIPLIMVIPQGQTRPLLPGVNVYPLSPYMYRGITEDCFTHVISYDRYSLEMLDKIDPPSIADGYGLSLGFYCLMELVKSIQFLVEGDQQDTEQSISRADSGKAVASDGDKQLKEALINSSWCGMLAALSLLLDASTDESATESVLKSQQVFARLCGLLEMHTPRDAFITSLCKASLPPHYTLTVLNAQSPAQKGHQRSPSQGQGQDVQVMSTEAIERSQVVAVGTPLPTAALPIGAHQGPVMLTAKNIQCMRALLSVAHCHGSILGTAWHLVLTTLQHLVWILGLKPSTGGSLKASQQINESNSAVITTAVMADLPVLSSMLSRLFESSQYLDDVALHHLIDALCKLSTESMELAYSNRGLYLSWDEPSLFAVAKLLETGLVNLSRVEILWRPVTAHLLEGSCIIRISKRSPKRISVHKVTAGTLVNSSVKCQMDFISEDALRTCMLTEKEWKCPVQNCGKILSRRQTLQSHLSSYHGIKGGNPVKRYKLYETDESVAVPYTTLYRKRKSSAPERQCTHDQETNKQILVIGNEDPVPVWIPDDIVHLDDGMELDAGDNAECDDIICDEFDQIMNQSSSEDEDDQASETLHQTDDPAIFVIPSSENLYQSQMTKSEHRLAVSAFSTRHNLSDTAMKDLLQLIQLHLPHNNICETNIHDLKESCGFDKSFISYNLYCDCCKKIYTENVDACQTPACSGQKTDSNTCKYFITSNLKIQIKEILERTGMWNKISASHIPQMSDTIFDVRSGSAYRELQGAGQFLNNTTNITLSMFTDGVPLFKSSGISLWPVYFLINEIPANERFKRKNMLLWGVWQGCGKPKMNMFLRPLVVDLLELYNTGVQVVVDGLAFNVKAMLIIATMDLQARAYVTNMTQHNGEYGCLYCKEPGMVVESGLGRCRSYIVHQESPALRSEAEFRRDAREAQEGTVRCRGLYGVSILSYLPYFSFTSNIVIDYMHGTLLGIVKKFLQLWFDSKSRSEPFFIGQHVTAIDRILKNIKPPYWIHRMPRVLSNTFHHWKASELRNWLLFYALPCLEDHLPTLYFKHFSCLVEATYLLLSEGILPADLQRADTLLNFFVKQASLLYGENIVSLNMHNLTHLVRCVKMWGPLWAWSCFSFESFNGEIKHGIHGTGNVCRQVFWNFQAQKRVLKCSDDAKEGAVKDFLYGMLDTSAKTMGQPAYQCKVIRPTELVSRLQETVKEQLQKLVKFTSEQDFLKISKIVRNGFVMYSSSSSKIKKQNSYTILLQKKSTRKVAVEVEEYILHKESRHVFAIGKMLTSIGSILEQRVPHLQLMEFKNSIIVIRAEELQEPMLVVRKQDKVFGALFPNHFERD